MTPDILERYGAEIEKALTAFLPKTGGLQTEVAEAMAYSLLLGGKRLRPALLLEFYVLLGGNYQDAVSFACAVEMIHTYSLIHDDLPCMDNDDMRRGKPSCHIKYGEDIALLAGDGLLTLAFETAAKTDISKIPAERILKASGHLAEAAGANGMVGGQVIDLKNEGKQTSLDTLNAMHAGKTVAMILVTAHIASVLAGVDKAAEQAVCDFASHIGLAFQIEDDILDVVGDAAVLGKKTGSDSVNEKSTYVTLLGLDKSKQTVKDLTDRAKDSLGVFGEKAKPLCELADYLVSRKA